MVKAQQQGSIQLGAQQVPTLPLQAGTVPATIPTQLDVNTLLNTVIMIMVVVMMIKVMTKATERV
jgi:hypothetical protein